MMINKIFPEKRESEWISIFRMLRKERSSSVTPWVSNWSGMRWHKMPLFIQTWNYVLAERQSKTLLRYRSIITQTSIEHNKSNLCTTKSIIRSINVLIKANDYILLLYNESFGFWWSEGWWKVVKVIIQ